MNSPPEKFGEHLSGCSPPDDYPYRTTVSVDPVSEYGLTEPGIMAHHMPCLPGVQTFNEGLWSPQTGELSESYQ